METLEELKEIIAGKPRGATHIERLASNNIYYLKRCNKYGVYGYRLYSSDHLSYVDCGAISGELRSLSDIERIIELSELASSAGNKIIQLTEYSISLESRLIQKGKK